MTGLLLDTPLTAEQREYAETVRRSGEALLTIIEDAAFVLSLSEPWPPDNERPAPDAEPGDPPHPDDGPGTPHADVDIKAAPDDLGAMSGRVRRAQDGSAIHR